MKQIILTILFVFSLFSCKKDKLDSSVDEPQIFDLQKIKADVALVKAAYDFAKIQRTFAKIQAQSITQMYNYDNQCNSHTAMLYETICPVGLAVDYLNDFGNYQNASTSLLQVNYDLTISNTFNTNQTNEVYKDTLLSALEVSEHAMDKLSQINQDQVTTATSLENSTMPEPQVEQEITNMIDTKEQQVINDPTLNIKEKEFIVYTLEYQKAFRNEVSNLVDLHETAETMSIETTSKQVNDLKTDSGKRRRLFGNIVRGLVFVGLSLASGGKFAALIAKKAIAKAKGIVQLMSAAAQEKLAYTVGVAISSPFVITDLVVNKQWRTWPWEKWDEVKQQPKFSFTFKTGLSIFGALSELSII